MAILRKENVSLKKKLRDLKKQVSDLTSFKSQVNVNKGRKRKNESPGTPTKQGIPDEEEFLSVDEQTSWSARESSGAEHRTLKSRASRIVNSEDDSAMSGVSRLTRKY